MIQLIIQLKKNNIAFSSNFKQNIKLVLYIYNCILYTIEIILSILLVPCFNSFMYYVNLCSNLCL